MKYEVNPELLLARKISMAEKKDQVSLRRSNRSMTLPAAPLLMETPNGPSEPSEPSVPQPVAVKPAPPTLKPRANRGSLMTAPIAPQHSSAPNLKSSAPTPEHSSSAPNTPTSEESTDTSNPREGRGIAYTKSYASLSIGDRNNKYFSNPEFMVTVKEGLCVKHLSAPSQTPDLVIIIPPNLQPSMESTVSPRTPPSPTDSSYVLTLSTHSHLN